ncbi:hypothetical protein BTVI_57059 [Pitangus sulphuratus]|nr:hypothetical protein BTVI_57059 [Pitangus sulphuratus]
MPDSAANQAVSAAASIDPSAPWLLESWLRRHLARLSRIESRDCTLLLRVWVEEILERNWHCCALEKEEGMAATSRSSPAQQQPKLCAMFWVAGIVLPMDQNFATELILEGIENVLGMELFHGKMCKAKDGLGKVLWNIGKVGKDVGIILFQFLPIKSYIGVNIHACISSLIGIVHQFDATLDVLSSAIVLWRYSNAAAVHSAHREYIACVILGVIFLLSSICIVIKAIHDLAKKVLPEVLLPPIPEPCTSSRNETEGLSVILQPVCPDDTTAAKGPGGEGGSGKHVKDDFLYSVSVLSGILCTVLAVIKFMLGKVLTSRALITDGFNSLVGGIMGFSILLSAEVFKHNSSVWYLDGSIGVLIGLTISAYGIKLLIDMVPRVRQTRHYEMFE